MLQEYTPQVLIAVPRLYENIYQGVLQKFAAGSVVQRGIVALVMFVSRKHMEARRVVNNARMVGLDEQAAWQQQSPFQRSARRLAAKAVQVVLGPLARVGDKLVWSKVRDALGGRVKCLVSGGSKLPVALDDFFEMARINMVIGYSLSLFLSLSLSLSHSLSLYTYIYV